MPGTVGRPPLSGNRANIIPMASEWSKKTGDTWAESWIEPFADLCGERTQASHIISRILVNVGSKKE
jgi:hypothetical protein